MILGFLSDIHLRSDRPRCRRDGSWRKTQEEQLDISYQEAERRQVEAMLIPGDLFHRSREEDWLVSLFIQVVSRHDSIRTYIMPGQHDLPRHSWNLMDNSSFGILWNVASEHPLLCQMWQRFDFCRYGEEKPLDGDSETEILLLHRLVTPPGKDLPFQDNAIAADALLRKYPRYRYIVAGDYHHGFTYEENGRYVIVPGCMNRQASDMIDYQPCWVFADTRGNIVERIPIPDDIELITDEFVRKQEQRELNLRAFIESIPLYKEINQNQEGIKKPSLDFEQNVLTAKDRVKLDPSVSEEVDHIMELAHGSK